MTRLRTKVALDRAIIEERARAPFVPTPKRKGDYVLGNAVAPLWRVK